MEPQSVAIEMKATEQYFSMELFILLYEVVLHFESVDGAPKPVSLSSAICCCFSLLYRIFQNGCCCCFSFFDLLPWFIAL